MSAKTVFTKDYVLLLDLEKNKIVQNTICYYEGLIVIATSEDSIYKEYRASSLNIYANKIIAYKKLNSQAEDLDLLLLPDWDEEVNVEKLARSVYQPEPSFISEFAKDLSLPKIKAFIKGFKKSQELSKNKLFTLEDVEKAIELAREMNCSNFEYYGYCEKLYSVEQIIQQLQQSKLPKKFICEFVDNFKKSNDHNYIDNYHTHNKMLKTIDTSQGKQVVGKWIY